MRKLKQQLLETEAKLVRIFDMVWSDSLHIAVIL
jgi:hypothetical protein